MQFPVNWTPRPYQLNLLQDMAGYKGDPKSSKKKALLCWGRQLGKDTTCGIYMFKQALLVPGNYFYIFPRSTDARRAFWEKVDQTTGLRLIDQLPGVDRPGEPGSMVARVLVQEMLIELTNKSTIRILGLDQNPDAARGISPAGVVFSEGAFMDPAVFANIEPAIAMNNAWVIYNSTPNGLNHFYKMYKHALSRNDWHVSFHQCRFPDKPGYFQIEGIDEDYFKGLVDSGIMTWQDVDREYGCDFTAELKGTFYADQLTKARTEGRIGAFPYNKSYAVNTFWDIGGKDDTVIWFAQNIRGKVYFIDYYESSGQGIEDIAHMLAEKDYRYGYHILPWDAGNFSQQTKLTTADMLEDTLADLAIDGVVEVIPKFSVMAGITAVRKKFNDYCFNEATVITGIERIELYHRKWDKRNARYLDDPVHDESSHAADALRLEAASTDLVPDPFFENNGIGKVTVIGCFGDEK